ncbi:Tyrosine-protein kinase abl1 [Balamuthia mandrillaris]
MKLRLGSCVLVLACLLCGLVPSGHAGCIFEEASFDPAEPAPGDDFAVFVTLRWQGDGLGCEFFLWDPSATWQSTSAIEPLPSPVAFSFDCDETFCDSYLGTSIGTLYITFTQRFRLPVDQSELPSPLRLTTMPYGSYDISYIPLQGVTPGFQLRAAFPSPPSGYYTPGLGLNYSLPLTVYNDGPFLGAAQCLIALSPQNLSAESDSLTVQGPGCNFDDDAFLLNCLTGEMEVGSNYAVDIDIHIEGIGSAYRDTVTLEVINCTGDSAFNGKTISFEPPEQPATIPAVPSADLKLSNGSSETEVTAGRAMELSFEIFNAGPSDRVDSSCTWEFPLDVTLLSRAINGGCSAAASTTTAVTCSMPSLLLGRNQREMLLQLDSGTELSRLEYSYTCVDETGVESDPFAGSLAINTFAEDLRVELNWLNPPDPPGSVQERQGEGSTVEMEMEMKSTGPSWARNVSCSLNFTRMDSDSQQPSALSLHSANFTSTLPTEDCLTSFSSHNSSTKTVVCSMQQISVETTTRWKFNLTTEEPLANLSISVSCQSQTDNNFAPIAWEAVYDVLTGRVIYPVAPPDDSSSTSSSSSGSTSSADSAEDDGSNTRTEEGEEESVGEKPEFIAGLTVGLLVLVVVVVVVLVAVVVLRKRASARRNKVDKDALEMEDGAEYGFKEDASSKASREKEGKASWAGGEGTTTKSGFAWEISFEDLDFEEEIGRGAFGVVWRGTWRDSQVAIKQLNITQAKEIDAFKAEAELMKRLRPHSNVVPLLGVCTEEHKPFCLVTEYLPEGNLRSFLRSKKGKQAMKDKKTFLRMAREIAAGMNHLHSEGITHRDLACRNLLLAVNLSIKVADFGLAREHEDVSNLEKFAADSPLPLKWIAPECLRSHVYSSKADVWSYGVTLWEMANGGADPYPGMPASEAAIFVFEGGSPDIPSSAPSVVQDIMQQCFALDPDQRPTFQQILQQLKKVG